MQIFEFDTVVIGSGLAGLSAAYHSSGFGTVGFVTKSELDTSNSYYAQGGIAAAIADDDTPELHLIDTFVAGRGLCDRDAVEVLVNEGRDRVKELIEMNMDFDKENGKLMFGLEGGHSRRRILHAGGDATGKEVTSFLLRKVKGRESVKSFEYTAVVKLIQQNGCIIGVQAIDLTTGNNIIFKAKAVILATGGLSRVFERSTNPHTATGDGIAMAYYAGAKIADMEFIQFHPSVLSIPDKEAFLISEAVRGEGAWLLNKDGERFMKDIHPLAELAPRDIVSYSIYKQLRKTNTDVVYLTLKHLDSKKIKKRFHNIYIKLKEYGFDLTKDLLPIAPAAHYMVGGIRTGLYGETNINGLFVCGETASTGVMGANRLASNSLLECLVFGKRASEKAATVKAVSYNLDNIKTIHLEPKNEQQFLEMKNEIATLMSKNVGILREKTGLEATLSRLNEICRQFPELPDEYNLIKIKNTAEVSRLITRSALTREESRGGHIREDFPEESPDFEVHITQQVNKPITFEQIRK